MPRFRGRHEARQRIELLGGEGFGIKLDFAAGRIEAACCERQKASARRLLFKLQPDMTASVVESLRGHSLHPHGLLAALVKRLRDQIVGPIAEARFGKAHALGKFRENPYVRARLAQWLDSLVRNLDVVVAIRA